MGNKVRLGGLAQKGYCASLKRSFYGVREHLVVTPGGMIAFLQQMPGNRYDVQGLYALLKTSFSGQLVADSAYWPRGEMRERLAVRGIYVTAETHSNWRFQYPAAVAGAIKRWRSEIERWISLFNRQFYADKTLCRSVKHYLARRWMKALSFNVARWINKKKGLPKESFLHFHLIAA